MLHKPKGRLTQQIRMFFLFVHTVKYLRWPQIWFRLYYRVRKVRSGFISQLGERTWIKPWEAPLRKTPLSILSLKKVTFLNEQGELNHSSDWNNAEKTKLWLYNLHYFDALNSLDAPHQTALLEQFINKWIQENPPYQGNGWEPYPLSIRLVNLVKWYSKRATSLSLQTRGFLGIQANALMQQLEYHIGGNHLFINGKALVFIGVFLEGTEALIWLEKGLKILDRELKEQFLKDGAHYELSPMYHALMIWDLCDLINLADCSNQPELKARKEKWQATLSKALTWLERMCHPDGGISFFNDATFGIAPSLEEIQGYAEYINQGFKQHSISKASIDKLTRDQTAESRLKAPLSLTWLKESGYCVVNIDHHGKAILDIGKIGPTYQPGHAHADSLSLELSLYGERVLVNSGISQYGNDLTRQLQRGTKAHNTVTINHENSSEVWGGFRVARRAYPVHLSIHENPDNIHVNCSHNGYRRLPGRNTHERQWTFLHRKVSIMDRIDGAFQTAEARFYFHPDILIQNLSHHRIQATLVSGNRIIISIVNALDVCIESTTWHPYFGSSIANVCLVTTFKSAELLTEIEW